MLRITRELVELFACPTCHARLAEPCLSRSGHTLSHEHSTRLVSRLWVCLDCLKLVERGRSYCPDCRARRDQRSKNESARLRRQRARGRWA